LAGPLRVMRGASKSGRASAVRPDVAVMLPHRKVT
jgi:hypothetical protein